MKTFRTSLAGTIAVALSLAGAYAQEGRQGTVSRLNEANGTIAITEAQTTGSSAGPVTEEYKVQDGLVFNAVKEGDRVTYAVQDTGGVKTVTKLEKQ